MRAYGYAAASDMDMVIPWYESMRGALDRGNYRIIAQSLYLSNSSHEGIDGPSEKRSRRSNRGVYGLSFLGEICCSRTSELEARPITCHMDSDPTSEQVEIHPQVEGHLMDARAQGE